MVVFSILKSTATCSSKIFNATKSTIASKLNIASKQCTGSIRQMSSKRTMQVIPSKFEYMRFKDNLHKYTWIGLGPIFAIIFGTNVYMGKCELAETPVDRTPEHWEYFAHPIARTWARIFHFSPEMTYETHMHNLNIEMKKRDLRRLEKKVRLLMSERQDSKGWYYVPMNKNKTLIAREAQIEIDSSGGPK